MSRVVTLVSPRGHLLNFVVDRLIEVGRECDGILVDDPSVSRRHLSIEPAPGDKVVVTDLGSSNGTELDDEPITGPVTLSPGQTVAFGDCHIRVTELVATTAVARPAAEGRPTGRETLTGAAASAAGASVRSTAVKPASSGGGGIRETSIDLVASQVSADRDSKAKLEKLEARTGGTLTFAFSDIESSTELAESMGDQRWFEALTAHNTIIEGLVGDYHGNIIKTIGDGFMITFPGATSGARCAIAIQRAMAEHAEENPELAIRVRMGLHTGEAIESGGDLFGTHVNMAARVANLADGGKIVVSSLTKAIAQSAGDLKFGPEEIVELKGLVGSHAVSELLWS